MDRFTKNLKMGSKFVLGVKLRKKINLDVGRFDYFKSKKNVLIKLNSNKFI